jgi:hypothetical protein
MQSKVRGDSSFRCKLTAAYLDVSSRFFRKNGVHQHQLQNDQQDIAFEQHCKATVAKEPRIIEGFAPEVPSLMSLPVFLNSDTFPGDTSACDTIDKLQGLTIHLPDPKVAPSSDPFSQTQIVCHDSHDIDFQYLPFMSHVWAQPQFTLPLWQTEPTASRPDEPFYYCIYDNFGPINACYQAGDHYLK